MHYFLTPFEKTTEIFNFYHTAGDLQLNECYLTAAEVFDGKLDFHEASKSLVMHLYSVSTHPKIKSGELYVGLFDNIQIEGELLQAIGIFKSENKESFLTVNHIADHLDVAYEQNGINIQKLDKGCLIFNTDAESGFKVAVIDNSPKSASTYWTDEFLHLQVRKDSFSATYQMMLLAKTFLTEKVDEEFEISNSSKVDLLNRAAKYFKEKESFDLDEFAGEVLGNEQAIASFKTYKQQYEAEFESVPDEFEISCAAVSKNTRAFKQSIKLDRNFQIQISGNKELIERGYDEDKGLNFYKVYFREESI